MARIEVVMPQMGESIVEGTIVKWYKKVGEAVRKDETLLEISTDKVDSEIPSPVSGILAEIVVKENQTVPVRTVVAYLETEAAVAASAGIRPPIASQAVPSPVVPVTHPGASSEPKASSGRFYSPLVLSMARAEGISLEELEQIAGTGESDRVTKKDLLAYVQKRKSGVASSAPSAVPSPAESALFDVIPMSNVMQRMAHHMVQSIHTSPHVAAIHEVDMTAVVKHREKHAVEFARREGFKLTFTPYVVDAVVKALKKFPLLNSAVEGEKILRKKAINVGLAVASENGLLVPVIHHAEEKNFLGFARAVNDLAQRARQKKLIPDDIQGGTFTISNYGVFGTMIGTPIINQPQVAILGTGAITKRPCVRGDGIAIRSIAYFTLSFDHRIIDGAAGGMFLAEVVRLLEETDVDGKL